MRWAALPATLFIAVPLIPRAQGAAEVQVSWSSGSGPHVKVGVLLPAHCWSSNCSQWKGLNVFVSHLSEAGSGILVNGTQHAVRFHGLSIPHAPEGVREAVRAAVQDTGVRLFIGLDERNSTDFAPLALAVEAEGGVLVTPTVALDSTSAANPAGTFVIGLPADRQLLSTMELLDAADVGSVAFLADGDDPASRAACAAGPALASERGILTVGSEVASFKQNRFGVFDALARLQAFSPDVLVACGSPNKKACRTFVDAMAHIDFNPKVLVIAGCFETSSFVQRASVMAEHILGVMPWAPSITYGAATGTRTFDVIRSWHEVHQTPPTQLEIETMAACELMVAAIRQAGSGEPAAAAGAMRALDTESLLGNVTFNAQGFAEREAFVIQYQGNNEYAVVAPREAATQTLRYPRPSWDVMRCSTAYVPPVSKEDDWAWVYALVDANGDGSLRCQLGCPSGLHMVSEDGMRHCRPCEPGKQPSDSGLSCEECLPGRYNAEPGALLCLDCPMGRYSDSVGHTACLDCPLGRFARSTGLTGCVSCSEWSTRGESAYAMRPGSIECLACPQGGLCEPDSEGLYSGYTSNEGFYTIRDESHQETRIYECVHDGGRVCLARDQCIVDPDTGEPAMLGPFCGTCRKGFGRNMSDEACSRCGDMLGNFALLLVCFAMTTSVVMSTFASSMTTTTRFRGTRMVVIRQCLSYIVLASVAFQYTDHKYPVDMGVFSFRDVFGLTGTTGGGIVQRAAHCVLDELFPGVEFFKICTIFGSFLAPCLVVIETLGYKLIRFTLRISGRPGPSWRHLVGLITITLYVLLPRITGLCLMPMDCFLFDNRRLLSDTRVLCNAEEHQMWRALGYAGFTANSLGIPLIMFMLLNYYKRKDALADRHALSMLGFLYAGLEPGAYYFECIYMMRNVLVKFVVAVPFFNAKSYRDANMMSCASLSILYGLFLIVHLTAGPYDNRVYFLLDRIETASLMAIWCTTMLQSWLQIVSNSRRLDEADMYVSMAEEACGVVVMLLHLRFWLIICQSFLRELWPLCCGKKSQSSEAKKRRRNVCTRCYKRWFSPGSVMVTMNGFKTINLSEDAQKLFGQLFAELVLELSEDGAFSWQQLMAATQAVCISAYHNRIKNRILNSRPLHFFLLNVKERVTQYPVLGSMLEAPIDRVIVRVSRFTHQGQHGVADEMQGSALDALAKFTQENADNIVGRRFTVEELYNALLRLGNDVKAEKLFENGAKEAMPGLIHRFISSSTGEASHQSDASGGAARRSGERREAVTAFNSLNSAHRSHFSAREGQIMMQRSRSSILSAYCTPPEGNTASPPDDEQRSLNSSPLEELDAGMQDSVMQGGQEPTSSQRAAPRPRSFAGSRRCPEPEPLPEILEDEQARVSVYNDMARLWSSAEDIFTFMDSTTPTCEHSGQSSARSGEESARSGSDFAEIDKIMREIGPGGLDGHSPPSGKTPPEGSYVDALRHDSC